MRSWPLAALLLTCAVQAQGLRLTSRWSADTVRVGEPVTLRLEVAVPPGSVPHFPQLELTAPGAALVQTRLEPLAVNFTFTFWQLGRMALPGIPVKVVSPDGSERLLQTDSLFIIVGSVLTGEEQDIREIKSMVAVKLTDPRSIWMKAAVSLVLAGILVLIWRTRRLGGLEGEVKSVSLRPGREALDGLRRLQGSDYPAAGAGEQYLELSRLLREYLERRFVFRALEMTTSEIIDLLPGELDDAATAGLIGKVLERSDLAKFAGIAPSASQWRDDLERALQIIERTRPELRQ
ncbi:MAG: hypothetical protein V3U35_08440 [Candidatus Neomarinimicrobiota bacterium]